MKHTRRNIKHTRRNNDIFETYPTIFRNILLTNLSKSFWIPGKYWDVEEAFRDILIGIG